MQTREAKIIRRRGERFVYITVQAEIPEKKPSSVLAVDLGIHNIAITLNSADGKPRFYGKKLRAVRGHYFHLRRKLPNRKAVKKVGRHEKHIVDHELHKISKAIVQEANRTNSAIVLGKLERLRKNGNGKGRGFNRKLSSFPYYKLSNYIGYKAKWLGILVLEVSEAYTSQICSQCEVRGIRVGGLFQCHNCGLDLNADWNGARNIMKRGIGELKRQSMLGAGLTQPRTLPMAGR